MRSLLTALAGAALAPLACPQQLDLSYEVTTAVPHVCTVSAILDNGDVVDAGATGLSASFNPVATPDIFIATLQARCNTGMAAVTVSTQNGFRLLKGGGGPNREIPFSLAVEGTPIASGITEEATYLDPDGTSADRRLTLDAGTLDPLALEAGQYTDTIIISVAPTS